VSGFGSHLLKLSCIGETEKNLASITQEFGRRFLEAANYYRYELTD